MKPEQLNDAADRLFRKALESWKNLRAVVNRVAPQLSDGFDFEKRRQLPRDFFMPNLKGRECDLLFEVPYWIGGKRGTALVCLLLEQQTKGDPNLILRMLIYAVFYWERQLRDWEAKGKGKGKLRLTPILPIVLSSSGKPWGTTKKFVELLDEPTAFHAFAPDWNPIFWELGTETTEKLLASGDPFVNLMSLVLSEGESSEKLTEIYAKVLEKLDAIPDAESGRWRELFEFAVKWMLHRRPKDEQADWLKTTDEVEKRQRRRKEIGEMKKSIADGLIEEGIDIGRDEGRVEGRIEALQDTILRIGTRRFGSPSARMAKQLREINDAARLQDLCDLVLDIPSWREMFSR